MMKSNNSGPDCVCIFGSADRALPSSSQSKTFLDLPSEIRLMVYRHLFNVPPSPEVYDPCYAHEERLWTLYHNGEEDVPQPDATNQALRYWGVANETFRPTSITRRSLLMTCRIIREEWTPLFWSSTTVVLGSTPNTDPETFERQFLARDEYRLPAIRKLVYFPLKWRSQVGGRAESIESEYDHSGVLKVI